jgi:peptidyl-prolyl cis-trans isomerase C
LKRRNNALIGFAAVVFFLAFGLSIVWAEQTKNDKEVLVKIGGEVITRADLELRISGMPPEMQKKYATKEQKKEYLDQLVRGKLLALEAKASGIDQEKIFSLRLQDTVNRTLANEYIQKNVYQVINVTDKDTEAWYNAHKDDFKNPAMVKAQHILVRVPPETTKIEDLNGYLMKAEHIKSELTGGASFEKLAEKYSDDVMSKMRGGDLGLITRKKVLPEFAEAAFALKKNEISKPVKTRSGYHIINVKDITESSHKTLKEAESEIRTLLLEKQRRTAIEREVERLKKKYKVVYDE